MMDMDALGGGVVCTLQALSDEVDAGAEVSLQVEVTAATQQEELAGRAVTLRDAADTAVARAVLEPAEEEAEAMGAALILTAPATVGRHRYLLQLAGPDGSEDPPAAETGFELDVVAHRIAPVVWEVPQAVEPGAEFTVRVGARCSAECDAKGWMVTIRDAAGAALATAYLGAEAWPGTEGLCHAELSMTAPDEIGPIAWEAVVEAPEATLPHAPGRRRFGLRVAPPADARLWVEALDAETGAPAAGIKVVAGPFRTRTDPDGRAELAVPRGALRVFVSGGRYIPHRAECEVAEETTLRVALEPDAGLTEAMIWG